jgi:hypothetical protein
MEVQVEAADCTLLAVLTLMQVLAVEVRQMVLAAEVVDTVAVAGVGQR